MDQVTNKLSNLQLRKQEILEEMAAISEEQAKFICQAVTSKIRKKADSNATRSMKQMQVASTIAKDTETIISTVANTNQRTMNGDVDILD